MKDDMIVFLRYLKDSYWEQGICVECVVSKAETTTMNLVFLRDRFGSTQKDLPDTWSHLSTEIRCATPRPALQR